MAIPYFFDQTPQLPFFSLFVLVQLLIKGGVYFIGKPVDSNHDWIRYMEVIQPGLSNITIATSSAPQHQHKNNHQVPLRLPMASPLVSLAQEAWWGCVYCLYSPGLVRHAEERHNHSTWFQTSTKQHEELTHRNIEKLGEIRTPFLTARPALQNTTGSDAIWLTGRNWPLLRPLFVAY